MKLHWNIILNFLILLTILVFLIGFQTTFWFQFFGNISAPMLWLNLVVYVALYRKPAPAILTIYALGFVLISYTAMPIKMMWLSLLILFLLIYGIKSRVFWAGSRYYAIMCAFSAFIYHVIYFMTSMFMEKNPASFEIADRLIQIILTPLFAIPMHVMLSKLYFLTQDEKAESGGISL